MGLGFGFLCACILSGVIRELYKMWHRYKLRRRELPSHIRNRGVLNDHTLFWGEAFLWACFAGVLIYSIAIFALLNWGIQLPLP